MRSSLILCTATRFLLPIILMFSFFILLRGHNEPGGGFIGGLVAASAFALYAISHGVTYAQQLLKVNPIKLIASGLIIALSSGLFAVIKGSNFMQGYWSEFKFPVIGKIGTPLIFDIGVYFLVLGIALLIIFSLAEEEEEIQ